MRAAIAARGGRAFATLTRPAVALPVWLVGWYVVHLGAVYDAAVRSTVLLAAEHAFLIAIGLLFWWPVLCDVPRAAATLVRDRLRLRRVRALGVPRARADVRAARSTTTTSRCPERLWGITAEQDQNLGGILMSTEQALVFFAAIVWLLVRLFREEAEAEERLAAEQRAAGSGALAREAGFRQAESCRSIPAYGGAHP